MKSMQVPPARRPFPSPSVGKRSPLFWWEWWSRHTTAPMPPPGAALPAIQQAQRGKMNSFLLLVILCLSLIRLLSALIGSSPIFAFLTAGSCIVCIGLLVLNRRGKSLLVGLIIWAAMTATFDLELFHLATLSPAAIPLFDLLVGNELLAALILPLPFLALAACWNSVFALVALALLPHTPFLESVIAANAAQLSLWSVALYVLVAAGIWLLVWMGEQMNPAAEVAGLQQAMLDEQLARRHMEDSLRWMEESVGRVLGGDLSARIRLPEEEGTPCWSLALTLNQALSRLERLSQVQASHQAMLPLLAEQQSLEDMQVALDQDMVQVMQALRLAEAGQQPIRLGTPRVEELRPLFRALHQKYLTPLPWS
jgi:hypothetical protein